MEWFEFEKKQPHIGEEILVMKTILGHHKIFVATYLGRERIDSRGVCDVKLANFKRYIQKNYSSQFHCFISSCLRWARLN